MKVRIGFGLGTRTNANDHESFTAMVDALEQLRFDSLWLSEAITGNCPDPIVGLAYAAALVAWAWWRFGWRLDLALGCLWAARPCLRGRCI